LRSDSGSPESAPPPAPRARKGAGRLERLPPERGGGYRLQVSLGLGPDGKRLRRVVRGRRLTDVYAARDALVARHRAGQLAADVRRERQTLRAYLEGWLADKRRDVEPSTWRPYRNYLSKHVLPALGGLRLAELAPPQGQGVVRALYRRLSAPAPAGTGLAPQSVLHVHRILSQALARAVDDGLLPRNPCQGVSPGKVPPSRARALSPEEVRRLLASSTGDWRCLWLVALTTGLRLGELLGLSWGREGAGAGAGGADEPGIDLERALVRVRQALVADDEGVSVVRPYPKSRAGRRAVPLPPEAVEALRDQRRRQIAEQLRAADWPDAEALVFLTRRGTPQLEGNVGRAFKRDAARAGVALIRGEGPHLLRHTYASHLLAGNRPVTEVAHLMGHSSAAVTLRIYAHWIRTDLDEAREAIRRAYGFSASADRAGDVR
jgi:integrase